MRSAVEPRKPANNNASVSQSPNGEVFPLPSPADYAKEFKRLKARVAKSASRAPGHSWARFFRNQERLKDLRIAKDLKAALKGADAVVFAVRHEPYLKLTPDDVRTMTGRPVAVVDCFGILDDEKIRRYFELGCEVKGLGRGHVKRIKDAVHGR